MYLELTVTWAISCLLLLSDCYKSVTLINSGCRGGVLEPEGTVAVQFKQRDLVQTMKRIDPLYNELFLKNSKEEMPHEERKKRVSELRNREAYLLPAYHMVIFIVLNCCLNIA